MAEKAEATVVFGVLNETSEHESRVALTPDIVTRLRKSGVTCLIESGAGVASHYVDEDYTKAGAQVVSADDVIARADALGFVDRPSNELLARVKQGTWIIGMLGSFTDADYVAAIEKAGLVGVAMEKLPRQLSSAQSMDEMTSQNSVMGYKAAIVAANAYGSFLPMMTTAAGTIRPAKVLILGAGIAGLQAIGTAKRLGAVVTAYDVRPASKGEVESLGAKFLDLGLDFQGPGRRRLRTRAERRRAGPATGRGRSEGRRLRHRHHHRQSAGTQASGPSDQGRCGRSASWRRHRRLRGKRPWRQRRRLLRRHPGHRQRRDHHRRPYLASGVSTTASNLLSRNVADVLAHFVRDGKLAIDLNEELDNAMVVAGRGEEAKKEEE